MRLMNPLSLLDLGQLGHLHIEDQPKFFGWNKFKMLHRRAHDIPEKTEL